MSGPGTAPGQAPRDLRAERECAEFTGWMEAQGNPIEDSYDEYGFSDMHEAFSAGMQAERDLAAAAPAPQAEGNAAVHLSPRDAAYVTPCCGQTPFDLARTDRMTNDPSRVTCGGPGPQSAPEPIIVSPGDGTVIGGLLAHVMGTCAEHEEPQAAPEIRTCYCGTTATVVPGVFPHDDCDGSVPAQAAPELAAAMAQLAARWEGEADTLLPEQEDAVRSCAAELRKAMEA